MIRPTRHRYERLGLLLFVLVSISVKSTETRITIDYALQVRPVSFIQDPTSTAALVGSSVMFGCNVSIAPLVSDYPLPTLTWRLNGSMDTSPQSSWQIRPNSGEEGYNYFSELHIESVAAEDAGYYECVSFDGGGRYVTISSRAWLTVVSVNPVPDIQPRQVVVGSPLLLSCDTGATLPPEQVQWFRDGIPLSRGNLSEEWDVLSNGSFLVFSASQEDAGNYSCTGWITGYPLNSSQFDITITERASPQSPQLLVDPSRAQLAAGESLNLTCYIVGEINNTDFQMRWRKEEETIATSDGSRRLVLELEISHSNHTGVYTCEVVMDGMTLQASAHVTVTFPPTISSEHVQDDQTIRNTLNNIIELSCDVTGSPTTTVYWYKNGQDVSQQSVRNASTGRTNYTARSIDSSTLLGTYQCFAVNRAGVTYRIFRVLEFGFANPPGNLTCSLTLKPTRHGYSSWIILDWIPPLLSTIPPSLYSVEYERFRLKNLYGKFNVRHVEIGGQELAEGVHLFSVRVDHPGEYPLPPPSNSCRLDTGFNEMVRDATWPLSVSCQGRTSIDVEWLNPTFAFPQQGFAFIQRVHLNGTCLYGNTTDLEFYHEGSDCPEYECFSAAAHYTLSVPTPEVPSGAVCLFGGDYMFEEDAPSILRPIPPELCIIPAKTAPVQAVQLGLSCKSSVATISWSTSPDCHRVLSLTLHGMCLGHDWTRLEYDVLNTTDPAGITTVNGIPNNAICTFYGSYQHYEGETREIDPVQCVMGRDVDPQYRLNTTYNESDCIPPLPETPSTTPTTTTAVPSNATLLPPSPSLFPSSGPSSKGFTGYWWAVLSAIGVVSILTLTLVMLLLVIKYLNKDKEEEVKRRMAELVAQSFPKQEDAFGPDIHPRKEFDALSQATECDYLSRPKNMTFVTKKSLSSLMEEDGKPHLFTKLFQSQSTGVIWSSCEEINSPGMDHVETDTPQPHDQIAEGSSWCLTDMPTLSESVPIADSVGHPFVRIVNSGGTSSSGYGTENYYLSDTSCGYNTSQHPNSCYGSKFDESAHSWLPLVSVKEELETANLRTCEQSSATSDPNNLNSESNDGANTTSSNINDREDNTDEGVRTTSPETCNPKQDEHTMSLLPLTSIATADCKSVKLRLKLRPQKVQKVKQADESDSHPDSSPLSEFSEYGNRSPHHSTYYTDDEGYVHMGYALPAEATV